MLSKLNITLCNLNCKIYLLQTYKKYSYVLSNIGEHWIMVKNYMKIFSRPVQPWRIVMRWENALLRESHWQQAIGPVNRQQHMNPVELTLDQCIKCNVCVTACPVTAVTDLFPGPKYEAPQASRFRGSKQPLPDNLSIIAAAVVYVIWSALPVSRSLKSTPEHAMISSLLVKFLGGRECEIIWWHDRNY